MYTDPDKLLPQHQHLLLIDKEKLTESTLDERQTWVTKIEVAIKAKEVINRLDSKMGRLTEEEGEMDGNGTGEEERESKSRSEENRKL